MKRDYGFLAVILLAIALAVLFIVIPQYAGATGPCYECPPGPEGPQGPRGPAGPPGQDGSDGGDGSDGVSGQGGGSDGSDGSRGPQGVQGPAGPAGPAGDARLSSCPSCFNDRIDMAVATATAIPDVVLFPDKKAAIFMGLGQANGSVAFGVSTVIRINGSWVTTAGAGANLTENCGRYCVDKHGTFEYITARVAIGYQF